MSKRSYRRLAVVAGAALAIGSMAPAMAAQVVSTNAASAAVDVDTIDVAPILGLVQSNGLSTTALLNSVSGVRTIATTTAFGTVADVQNVVGGAIFGAQCVVGTGTSAVLGLSATALANAGAGLNVGLGGVGLGLGGGAVALAGAPALVGSATGCIGPLQAAALGTVGSVQGAATTVAGLASGTALTAVSTAPGLVRGVITTATPLLLNDLLNIGVSGGASSSTVAGLGGLVNFM